MKSKKGWKILIGIVGLVVLLLVVASVVVKVVFTKEKLLSILVPRVERALDREVDVEDITVSIWGGLGADVKGMTVWNKPGFAQKELFKFDQLSIRVKFWPLLRKRIEVKKLILTSPRINLEINKEGISNFQDLIKSEAEAIVLPAAFDQLQITDGQIVYLDEKSKKAVILRQFEQNARLSLDEKMENAELIGSMTVPSIELNLPGYKGTLPPLTLSLEHDLNLNMPDQSLEIRLLKVGIARILMDVKGRVEKLNAAPALNLSVQSGGIPLKEVLASLPKEESSPLNQLGASGDLNISASIQGETEKGSSPQIEGKITLKDARIDFASVPKPFLMPYGEANFNNRSMSFFSSEAKLGDAPMELKLVLEDFSDPSLTSELRAKINLALIKELVALPEKTSLSGKAEVNVKAYGKTKKMEKMILSGRVDLEKVEAATPLLGVPVRNLDAAISLKDGDLDISKMSMSMGKSSLSLQGKLYGAIASLLSPGKGKPLFRFSLQSPFVDLDEIFPVAKKGQEKQTRAASDSVPLPGINASGQISIQRGIFRGIEFNNLASSLDVVDGVVKLDNIVAQIYSGTVGGEVSSDLKRANHVEFDMNLTANAIQANDFLTRFTAFDDHLFGKLNLNARFAGRGNSIEDIRRSLSGDGTASFAEGKLVNWGLLDSLGSFLGLKFLKEQQIRTLRNSFKIADGRVRFDDFSVSTKEGDFELVGSVGLDGSLDYKLAVTLSPELSQRFDAVGGFSGYQQLTEFLKNDQGRVVLDLKVGGTAKRPKFVPDFSRAEKKAGDRLKAKVEEKKEELKDQLQEKAQDLIKDMLKKKKK